MMHYECPPALKDKFATAYANENLKALGAAMQEHIEWIASLPKERGDYVEVLDHEDNWTWRVFNPKH